MNSLHFQWGRGGPDEGLARMGSVSEANVGEEGREVGSANGTQGERHTIIDIPYMHTQHTAHQSYL